MQRLLIGTSETEVTTSFIGLPVIHWDDGAMYEETYKKCTVIHYYPESTDPVDFIDDVAESHLYNASISGWRDQEEAYAGEVLVRCWCLI